MRKTRSFYLFCILSFYFNSCTTENVSDKTGNYQMVESESIKLRLDSLYSNSAVKSKTIIDDNGIEWLYANFTNSAGIPIYNLSTNELHHIISTENEGPDGIGNLLYSDVLNIDSVLVISKDRIRIFLLNSKGEKLDTYNLIYGKTDNKNWKQTMMQHPYLYKGKFYFSLMPDFDVLKRNYELDDPIFAKTITRDSVEIIPEIKYPAFLKKTSKNEVIMPEQIFPSYLVKDNLLVFTIPSSDSIYTFNLDTKKMKNYYARSKFQKDEFRYLKRNTEIQEQLYQTFLYF